MGIRQSLANLERVGEVATLAGIKGQLIEDRVEYHINCGLDQGRFQRVFIRDSSKEDSKKTVITIFSPARIMKKGLFSGLSKEQAFELLRMNERMIFARFGIWETKSEIMVVASIDHLLDTLDPDELKASTYCVAMAADDYERRYGKDEF